MKTIIHVNRHIIDRNRKEGRSDPALSIIQRGRVTHAHEAHVLGPCTVVHVGNGRKPLKCGAKVWIETTSPVEVQ